MVGRRPASRDYARAAVRTAPPEPVATKRKRDAVANYKRVSVALEKILRFDLAAAVRARAAAIDLPLDRVADVLAESPLLSSYLIAGASTVIEAAEAWEQMQIDHATRALSATPAPTVRERPPWKPPGESVGFSPRGY